MMNCYESLWIIMNSVFKMMAPTIADVERSIIGCDIVLKMMDFVLKMMDFVPKPMPVSSRCWRKLGSSGRKGTTQTGGRWTNEAILTTTELQFKWPFSSFVCCCVWPTIRWVTRELGGMSLARAWICIWSCWNAEMMCNCPWKRRILHWKNNGHSFCKIRSTVLYTYVVQSPRILKYKMKRCWASPTCGAATLALPGDNWIISAPACVPSQHASNSCALGRRAHSFAAGRTHLSVFLCASRRPSDTLLRQVPRFHVVVAPVVAAPAHLVEAAGVQGKWTDPIDYSARQQLGDVRSARTCSCAAMAAQAGAGARGWALERAQNKTAHAVVSPF